jgi:hypothetical protein
VEAEKDLLDSPEAIQARAREAWVAYRAKDLQSGASAEDVQRLARERWQEYRRGQGADKSRTAQENQAEQGKELGHSKDDDQSL